MVPARCVYANSTSVDVTNSGAVTTNYSNLLQYLPYRVLRGQVRIESSMPIYATHLRGPLPSRLPLAVLGFPCTACHRVAKRLKGIFRGTMNWIRLERSS